MGRKKMTAETAAPRPGLPPAKSDYLRKYPATVEFQRPLEPADYESIQKAMVARNRQKLDLITELNGHNAKIKEVRRQIATLGGEVEADLLTIESGTITEGCVCLCVKDSKEETITKLDPMSGKIYQTEVLPQYYQRDFIFTQTPDDDCHSCKYLVCLKAAQGETCESYLDCHDCPGFSCVFESVGSRCGFGKHDPEAFWGQFPTPDDLARDCFFCESHNCEYPVGAVGNCPTNEDGRRVNCRECAAFTCDCSDDCQVEARRTALADDGSAGQTLNKAINALEDSSL